MNKKLVPKRRFKGFTGNWEQFKLGNLGSVTMNKRIFKDETTDSGDVPFYKIGTFGGEPDAYISRELFEEYKIKYPYPEVGDILISASGSIGRTVVYKGEEAYFQDSNIVWLKHDDRLDNSFLKQFYTIVKWQGLEGSTIKRLYNKNILDTEINIPSPNEQKKVGEFFGNFDNLIASQQRKLNKAKALKSAYLSEMFPAVGECKPKRRFAGFTDDWKQCELSNIATMKARIGWQGLTKKEFLDEGEYYLITGTDFENGQIDFKNIHFIGEDRYKQDVNIQIKNGDVLITKDGTIGKVAYVDGLDKPATLNAGVFVIRGKSTNVSNLYLYHYLAAPYLLKYADKQATGGTIKHLNQNVLVNFPVPIPNIIEQKKIGQFLSNLDSLIKSQQQKLDKLENMKKAYLNEMFI
ncbi:restriction endonuclease subunit S [Bacillus cereus]|uniref:restriction endonuclease subunit S n=1 Tax=Bacillus cereus TaxID=1396 RepID=UPI000BF89FBD|nr:restriction endonuclease subunit S [Bacillus cereus]PFH96785.1 restriction endonuclease subunit S [Bacillus cereus]